MTIDEAGKESDALHQRADSDGDALLTVYFSRADDRFEGRTTGMDAGDALVVIGRLMDEFGLDAGAVAGM